jgi:hypothetical protein
VWWWQIEGSAWLGEHSKNKEPIAAAIHQKRKNAFLSRRIIGTVFMG